MAQTPTKGRIVHYTNRRRPKADDTRPPSADERVAAAIPDVELDAPDDHEAAMIVGVNPDGTVDLVVEYRNGARVPMANVDHHEGPAGELEARGLWSWPVQVPR